ncbi:MAG: cyclophilin-like family protein [Candidatus Kariarchaeaceae archaeon]
MSSNLETYKLILKFPNLGEVKITLHRIAAARTVQKIAFAAPFNSRGMKRGETFQIPTEIAIGKEKAIQSFKKGQVSFSPQGQMINIHLKDNEMPSPENRVGEVTEGLEIFEKIKLSSSVIIEREE